MEQAREEVFTCAVGEMSQHELVAGYAEPCPSRLRRGMHGLKHPSPVLTWLACDLVAHTASRGRRGEVCWVFVVDATLQSVKGRWGGLGQESVRGYARIRNRPAIWVAGKAVWIASIRDTATEFAC